MNQDFEHFDPKELKRLFLKRIVLLDWAVIERQLAWFYCKRCWRKLKRPVVLPPQLVEAQQRIGALKKKLKRAQQRTEDITAEILMVELALRNYVWYAVDPERAVHIVGKSRADLMPSEQTTLEDLMRLPPRADDPDGIPEEEYYGPPPSRPGPPPVVR